MRWQSGVLLPLLLIVGKSTTLGQQLIPNESQQLYELSNKVALVNLKSHTQSESSYTFKTQLRINSVWHSEKEQLLQVFFTESSVSAPSAVNVKSESKPITQPIEKIPDRPFYISLVDSKPTKVIAHTSRDQSLLNLERAIASLLQLQHSKHHQNEELDVSGQCRVIYDVKSSTRIEKTKTDCSHWDLRVNYRAEKPLSVEQHSQEHISFELSADGQLLKAKSIESHHIILAAKPDVGTQIESLLILKHRHPGTEMVEQLNFATLQEAIESMLDWYRVFDIEADVDGKLSAIKDKTLTQQVAANADVLTNSHIGSETLALVFAELLPLARLTKQAEFVELLQAHKELQGQLVDLLGATQTVEAHKAVHEVLQYTRKDDADVLEKYLQSLAVGTHPERGIIEDLAKRLQRNEVVTAIADERLRDVVTQTLAAITKQFNFESNDSLLQQIRSYFVDELESSCPDIVRKTRYIRALQNLQDTSTIPILLINALSAEVKVSVASLQALHSFPAASFNETHRQAFADIFYQRKRKFDSSARILALDILLSIRPTKEQVGELLDYLTSNDRHFEIKTYIVQKLRTLAEKCSRFRALLSACLAERPLVNNYDVIAQKGLTTVLIRQLSQTPAFNESLLSVQEIYQGVLKRGSVDLILSAGREETSTFKLGIFTNGLSSIVGDGEAPDAGDDVADDDSPTNAGMEISVQGVLLRPLIFFNSQTELMGHVWSGTASEPTPAFQATMLTQDHEHYIMLSSGATVYSRIIGAKSVDLNGKVDFSLWNRNANTEIQQNSGAAISGLVVVGFTYAHLENSFSLTNEPKISLKADIDFYSNIKLCMQLQRPEMILTHVNTKTILLNATKSYVQRRRFKTTHKSVGRTLALNQKNNEMCNQIFS